MKSQTITRTSKMNTRGFEIMNVEFQFGFSTGILINCYDMYSYSYGLNYSQIYMIDVDFENDKDYNNHELFISICKAVIDFFNNHKLHKSLKEKLGKYSDKDVKYTAGYFLAKLRNLMGVEYLPLPLSTYIKLSNQL